MSKEELKSLIDSIKKYFRNTKEFVKFRSIDNWDRDFKFWKGDDLIFNFNFHGDEVVVEFGMCHAYGSKFKIRMGRERDYSTGVDFLFEFDLPLQNGDHDLFCQMAHAMISSNHYRVTIRTHVADQFIEGLREIRELSNDYISSIKFDIENEKFENTSKEFLDFEMEVVKLVQKQLICIDDPHGIDIYHAANLLFEDSDEEAFNEYRDKALKISNN